MNALYRAVVGTINEKGEHFLNELVIHAKGGNAAMRQAIRCANKLNGVLTYVALMENGKDRVLFNSQEAGNGVRTEEVEPRLEDRTNSIPVETGANSGKNGSSGGTDPGTNK